MIKQRRFRHDYYGYFFILPFIVAFLVFGLYPVYNTFALSFTNTTIMKGGGAFIGLQNFKRLFADNVFMTAIINTWRLWLLNFIPQIGIAMLLAVWFTNARLRLRGVGIWRGLFYLPNLLMPAAIAALFFSLFSYYGPMNQLMVRAGFISEARHWLQDPFIARTLVVFIQWWMWFGSTLIILMAGMTSIPVSLYEAAMVDGATSAQMLWRITLPLLRPILIYIFVTSMVGGMQMFDIPFLLTDGRGSPNRSILTNNILMYMKFSSADGHIGASSAVGVMVFLMTCVCAFLIFRLLRDRDRA